MSVLRSVSFVTYVMTYGRHDTKNDFSQLPAAACGHAAVAKHSVTALQQGAQVMLDARQRPNKCSPAGMSTSTLLASAPRRPDS